MIYLFYYLIFAFSLSVIFVSFFVLSNYVMKRYPKSKLSNFFRTHIISDVDEEPHN
jgi:hypothetical protein